MSTHVLLATLLILLLPYNESFLTQEFKSRILSSTICIPAINGCSVEEESNSGPAAKDPVAKDHASSPSSSRIKEKKNPTEPKEQRAKRVRPRIPVLQYHDDWVCVNKPAGLTVHRAASTPRSQFVLSTLLKRQLSRKVYPVHRLDHRTSGAILFAFDSETCGLLHRSLTFGHGQISDDSIVDSSISDHGEGHNMVELNDDRASQKEYIALLRGNWRDKFDNDVVIVDKPLMVKGVSRQAETEFHLLADYAGPEGSIYHPSACSLVLCKPRTGRTHQIRRHARHIGHPILGDTQHGDSKINRWWREKYGMNRLFLHSFSLDLPCIDRIKVHNDKIDTIADSTVPVVATNSTVTYGNDRIYCVAPLPLDLSKILQIEIFTDLWKDAIEKDPRLLKLPYDERSGTFGRNYRIQQSLQG